MTEKFHVVVIGGGTGGLCLTHGLREAGVSVAVYERSQTRTERLQGYRVHINPQGARALNDSLPPELWERFVATTGTTAGAFGFVTEQLRELLLITAGITAENDPARAHHSASRITLHQVLSSRLDGVLHYDKEFERYERGEDGKITCFFTDGTTAHADVLIAADGANSRVRRQYLPHAQRRDTGILTIAGKFPLTEKTKALLPKRLYDGPNSVMPPSGCGMFTAPHELGNGVDDATAVHDPVLFDNTSSYVMWGYAAEKSSFSGNPAEMDEAVLRDTVSELIADWHPGLRRLVADSPTGTVSLLPILTSVPIDPWPSTNITLLGDAIHSMTPFRGIGANIALRDANLLRRNLIAAARGEIPLSTAIADYEKEMTGYGFAAVKDSLRAADQFASGTRAGRIMFKSALRFVNAVPPLKRRAFSDKEPE
jgi:2-polyprenyl-6-methoxyphenol hydroxylase-like FAD-dependent oxidoreductase